MWNIRHYDSIETLSQFDIPTHINTPYPTFPIFDTMILLKPFRSSIFLHFLSKEISIHPLSLSACTPDTIDPMKNSSLEDRLAFAGSPFGSIFRNLLSGPPSLSKASRLPRVFRVYSGARCRVELAVAAHRERRDHLRVELADAAHSIRLNKFISHAGICARRAADALIQSGHISVNGQKVHTLGYKVTPHDIVTYHNQVIKPEKQIYILLNKPKDYITTTTDPRDRKTVLELIQPACDERVYPIGRLDRKTTGLLLLTNDGTLANKLTHPSHHIKKLYHVLLDKPLRMIDYEKIKAGVVLEDGVAHVDQLDILRDCSIRMEIHMGRNRVIRRIFEQLGYTVVKLDRRMYACLGINGLARGKWRLLTDHEVKHLYNES